MRHARTQRGVNAAGMLAVAMLAIAGCEKPSDQQIDMPHMSGQEPPCQVIPRAATRRTSENSASVTLARPPAATNVLPAPVFDLDTAIIAPAALATSGVRRWDVHGVRVFEYDGTCGPVEVAVQAMPTGTLPRTFLGMGRASDAGEITFVETGNAQKLRWTLMGMNGLSFYGWDLAAAKAPPYEWRVVAFTYDGSNVAFYVDGQLKERLSCALDTALVPLQIGTRHTKGVIRTIKIWNMALSSNQVAQATYEELLRAADLL